jgi:hypothetical protein
MHSACPCPRRRCPRCRRHRPPTARPPAHAARRRGRPRPSLGGAADTHARPHTTAAAWTTAWRSHRCPPLKGGGGSCSRVRGGAAACPLTTRTPPSCMSPPVGDELDRHHPQAALTTVLGGLSPAPAHNHCCQRQTHHAQPSSPPTLLQCRAQHACPVSRTPPPPHTHLPPFFCAYLSVKLVELD